MRRVFGLKNLDVTHHVHNTTLQALDVACPVTTSTQPTTLSLALPNLLSGQYQKSQATTAAPFSLHPQCRLDRFFDETDSVETERIILLTIYRVHHALPPSRTPNREAP